METQYCDMCTAPMQQTKFIGTKESGKKYRQTWFKCPICGYEKKVNGTGYYQDNITPLNAQDDVSKMYRQQERNNML